MTQEIITWMIIAVAALFVVRRTTHRVQGKSKCNCGCSGRNNNCDCGCDKGENRISKN